MNALDSALRNGLSRAILAARIAAEKGAREAIGALAVSHHEPHGSMTPEQRALRRKLRAHGRQLGDRRNAEDGTQAIGRLTQECAYEHWHRMLFARFLAENQLLIEPESGVAITLEECEDLAREEGIDPWEMAAGYAQAMLPRIFREDDPVLQVKLPPETRRELESLLEGLPAPVFSAADSLGWTYQYWQTEKKKAVNESGDKIGADDLPAVTQLFTENYMVLFLYHNTIGAWHASKVLAENPGFAETAQNEEELRHAVRLQSQGGYDFKYLRFVREDKEGGNEGTPTGPWRPAAGNFEGWPKTAKELKVLDPCCGSGHFLVEGFELLVRLRMEEEGLRLEDAICGVLRNSLHGLELDSRCTQVAAFNLALAAWKLIGKPIELPAMHIACSGLAVGSNGVEWAKLADGDGRLRYGMERLYDLFEQAPELGSLIDPKAVKGELLVAGFTELQPLLEHALERKGGDAEFTERVVAAQGMAKVVELLLGDYILAITNVPFLSAKKHNERLRNILARQFPEAKADLSTVFMARIIKLLAIDGTLAVVTPHEWLFQPSYRAFREGILQKYSVKVGARLGYGAFQTPLRAAPVLSVISNTLPAKKNKVSFVDLSEGTLAYGEKVDFLSLAPIATVNQSEQRRNPDSRLFATIDEATSYLGDFFSCKSGVLTSDGDRFYLCFWEVSDWDSTWLPLQSTVSASTPFGGRSLVIRWENGSGSLYSLAQSVRHLNHAAQNWRRGQDVWGLCGVAIKGMGNLGGTLYCGEHFDSNTRAIVPHDKSHLLALWEFCSSTDFESNVRVLDKSLKPPPKTFLRLPFNLKHWQKTAEEKYPKGLPEPQSDNPTQWLFHGHPAKAESATALQSAVGRLLGYRWPPELNPEMRLSEEAREWVARCEGLKEFADEDGIVCLSATRGEASASARLRELLAAAFGTGWSATKERELLAAAGNGKKPAASLEHWLRDQFFEEHCKLFHHRPFIWHIWDGNRDGFHCLVNAHKLTGPDGEGRRTLEAIAFSYLNDWIERQKADQQEGKEGADARLAAALDLQSQLVKILEGEAPYDLFVRWKKLSLQAIGWDPDIDDGVRLNIRPFMKAELRLGGKKGAGILRWKPNIKWKKDRGKEPQELRPKEDFPWFWSCDPEKNPDHRQDFPGDSEFDGQRLNDLHYSVPVKRAAREGRQQKEKEVEA
jgi:Eco57I restriction-modification methylase